MAKEIKLNNGVLIPTLGLGTWQSENEKVATAVKTAIELGYRHIDCARVYQNEKEVGEGVKSCIDSGLITRKDIFITSKLWSTDWKRVKTAVKESLKDLQLDYLDLYLIHAPACLEYDNGNFFPKDASGKIRIGYISLQEVWRQMEEIQEEGLVRSIGISNFPVLLIRDLLSYSKIKPAVHQIEIHPYFPQEECAQYCKENGIAIIAYSPLGRGKNGPMKEKLVQEIAKKYQITPAQVLIRWCIQKGYGVIPKSVNPDRIKENGNVFHFSLNDQEMNNILSLHNKHEEKMCDFTKIWNWNAFYAGF